MSSDLQNASHQPPASGRFELLGKVHGRIVHSRRVEVLARFFTELLPQNHSVLDVGCGDGLIDSLLVERRPDLTIQGVDVMVRPNAKIEVTQFDGNHLPFPDKTFDTILLSDVLHHTESAATVLKECARVARRCVLIKDHVVEGLLARPTLRFMDFVGNAPHGVVLPYNYLTQREWDDVFRECGMVPRVVKSKLGLYPALADAFFGRSLHFVGLYDIVRQ